MGQAPGQPVPRRVCRTQEISLGCYADGLWQAQTLSRWTTADDSEFQEPCSARGCHAAVIPPCCRVAEDQSVEEVLVVHHDALRKVNFLLKVDELSGCEVELPAVPECVAAARRAELQRRHHRLLKEAQPDTCDERRATGPGVALDAQLGVGSLPVRPGSAWLPPLGQSAEAPACPNGEDTESQVEEEMPRARTWDLPRTGAATRPRSQSYDDISDLDSCSELVEFGVGEAVQSAQEVNRIE
mmetsp:Transcript_8201/g.23450  ORF Transcript_8201/g.23450 Transcript_8201/m.23450 type:complete len:242 (+) Transcript_8201:146-871(+)